MTLHDQLSASEKYVEDLDFIAKLLEIACKEFAFESLQERAGLFFVINSQLTQFPSKLRQNTKECFP